MTFSYMDATPYEELDYIRFAIRDTTVNEGPLPENANFSDEEIEMMLEVEGSWQRAVAACYEALYSAWADHVSWEGDGISVSMSHVPRNYERKAQRQRNMFGYTQGQNGRVRTWIRVDGYSQDIPATQVDDVSY